MLGGIYDYNMLLLRNYIRLIKGLKHQTITIHSLKYGRQRFNNTHDMKNKYWSVRQNRWFNCMLSRTLLDTEEMYTTLFRESTEYNLLRDYCHDYDVNDKLYKYTRFIRRR